MKRRKFLTYLGVGAALTGVPAVLVSSKTVYEKAIVSGLKNRFSYLKLEPNCLAQFAKAFINFQETQDYAYAQKVKIKLLSSYVTPGGKHSDIEDYVAENFLLSTDFFYNKMDATKEVKFVSLFNPQLRPCSNPFSSAYYS